MLTRTFCRAIGLHNLARILYWISLLLLLLGMWILIDPYQRKVGQTVQVYITLVAFELYLWLLLLLARWQVRRELTADGARSGLFALALVGFLFIALNELYMASQGAAYTLTVLIVVLTLAKLWTAQRWMGFPLPLPLGISCGLWILMLALPAPVLRIYTEDKSAQHGMAYLFCWLVALLAASHLFLVRWQMSRDRQKVTRSLQQWWIPWLLPAGLCALTVGQLYSVLWSLFIEWADWYFTPIFLSVGVVAVLLSHARRARYFVAWGVLTLAILNTIRVCHDPIPADFPPDWQWQISAFVYYPFQAYGVFTCLLFALGCLLTNQMGLFCLSLLLPASLGTAKAGQQLWLWPYGKGIVMLLGAFVLLGVGAVLQWLQENGRRLHLWLYPWSEDPNLNPTLTNNSDNAVETNPIYVDDIPGTIKPPESVDPNSETQELKPETEE